MCFGIKENEFGSFIVPYVIICKFERNGGPVGQSKKKLMALLVVEIVGEKVIGYPIALLIPSPWFSLFSNVVRRA